MKRHLIAIVIGGVLVSTISLAQNTPIEIDTSAMQTGGEPEDFTFWRTGQGAGGEAEKIKDADDLNRDSGQGQSRVPGRQHLSTTAERPGCR
jgi:hypothetical protein